MARYTGVGVVAAFIIAAGARVYTSRLAPPVGRAASPQVVLWAWERPEDLRFTGSSGAGVAYLACSIALRDDAVIARPRLQPLKLPRGGAAIAVARLESDPIHPPKFSPEQRAGAVSALVRMAEAPGIAGIQIDYDATASERSFYRLMLADLRHQLPPSMPVSITALASWCLSDDWISDLPVDEAIPMLFRMGPDGAQVRRHLDDGKDFQSDLCRQSVGISTDEPLPRLPLGRRIYIFHPRSWSATAFEEILKRVRAQR